MSLKDQLNQLIKSRGYVSSAEIYEFCQREGFRHSNAERRLRKSESPDIMPVWGRSKRGTKYIMAYTLTDSAERRAISKGEISPNPSNLSIRKQRELTENQQNLWAK